MLPPPPAPRFKFTAAAAVEHASRQSHITQIHHACGSVARHEREPLTRPPLHTPELRRPPELRQSARPLDLTARCPTIARPPPPGAPSAASAAAAHPAAAARPPPAARRTAGHKRDARRVCGSVARRECGRSSPGRRCSAVAARPGAAPPAALAGAAPVRSPARPRSAMPDQCPPPPAARRAAGHACTSRRACGSVTRRERGRSSPGCRCSAAAARPGAAPPAASAGATPVRSPARLRSALPNHRPHPPPGAPPTASAAAAQPATAARPPPGAPPATSATPVLESRDRRRALYVRRRRWREGHLCK
ncbi:atherin-like [Sorghum bicolor]|uniref:atherin-like n=1 Tax=Sorghum bicolor TaxID=4558 RepID=UPI000B425E34|nr:atherin-like [Sorghum bicolor]|eukprot:XP_021303732.1 atherin-like [Sorghum bicolor]